MTRKQVLLALSGVIFWLSPIIEATIATGSDRPVSGSDAKGWYLSPKEVAKLEDKALAGDGKAAMALAAYKISIR